MTDSRWTEDFLNRLRKESDPRADDVFRRHVFAGALVLLS